MTLLPGDISQTGVPARSWKLKAGHTIEISIERLGTLRNRVVADESAAGKSLARDSGTAARDRGRR